MKSKRELILDAALKQFAEDGYSQATMQSIAKRAGVGKGTTYEYFPSKEALFSEVISNGVNRTMTSLDEELQKPGSVREKVERMYLKYLELYRAEVELKSVVLNDFGNIPKQFHQQLKTKQIEFIQVMDKVVQEGIRTGEIANINSYIGATILLGGIGIIMHASLDEAMLQQSTLQLIDILFNGLAHQQ